MLTLTGGAQQVVNQHLRVNFFLDVQGWRVDHQVAPVLLVLAAPDQLRVQVGIARVADLLGGNVLLRRNRLLLDRWNVFALGRVVGEGFDVFGAEFGGHAYGFPVTALLAAVSINWLNWASILALKSASIWYTSVNSANAQRP